MRVVFLILEIGRNTDSSQISPRMIGCGKSTVVGLLQRFYDPSIGTIRVDNNDLRTLDIKDHR